MNKKISDLPAATVPLSGAEKLEIVQGGINKQVDASDLGGGAVDSVNGQTGVVVLTKSDVGLGNADNTSDVNKPISTAQQTALDLKAPLASPALTGTPTVNGESVAPGLEPVDRTGTAIQFDVPATYGSVASPETGNITLNSTGLVKGVVQLLLHNSAIAPTFGAQFVKIGGNYLSSNLNSIYFHAVTSARIEYTINQAS